MNKEDTEIEELAPWLAGIITLIGFSLRVLLLDSKGLWLDETISVWMARQSLAEMLQWIVKIDQHPPLYYLLLHYWIRLTGDSAYSVRMLSVVFGAATIPVIYLLGKRISGSVTGLAAAVILAVSPFHLYFAQEARMYTLLAFNAAVAVYALVRLLTDPRSTSPIANQLRAYLRSWRDPVLQYSKPEAGFSYRDETRNLTGWRAWIFGRRLSSLQAIETDLSWLAFILFSAATMLSHNTAIFFPAAANIIVIGLVLFQRIRISETAPALFAPSVWNWVIAQVAILSLWSPWMFSFIKQANTVYQRFWIPEPTWDLIVQVLKSFLTPAATIPEGLSVAIWSAYVLILGFGVVHFRKKFSRFLLLAMLFAVPLLGELIVSIWRPIFWGRTLIWITIPLLLVLAAGIAQLRFRFLVLVVLGSLTALNLFSASDYYRFYQKEDWSTAAGYVANFAERDDLVLFNSNFVEIAFNYYFETYEEGYAIQVEKQGIPQDLFDTGTAEPMMTTQDVPGLIALLNGHKRVWLVYSHELYTDPRGLIPQTLASQMKLSRTREFMGGKVQLYVKP